MVDVDVEGPAEGVELLVSGTDATGVQHIQGRHARLSLDRGVTYAVMATAEGYKAEIGRIRPTENPAAYLDVVPVLIGLVGSQLLGDNAVGSSLASGLTVVSLGFMTLDILTHASWKHETNYVSLKLVPEATP